MNDDRNTGPQRGQRSSELSARLQHSRDVLERRRAAERQREQGVADAVREYWSAWQAIATIERRRDRRIQTLRDKIRDITNTAATDIAVHQETQAAAVTRMDEYGCKTNDIAELLEISTKAVRQFLAASRADPGPLDQTPHLESKPSPAESQPPSQSARESNSHGSSAGPHIGTVLPSPPPDDGRVVP